MGKLAVIMLLVVLLAGLVSVSPSIDVSAQEPLTSTIITKDWGYEYTALTGDKIEVGDKTTTEFKPVLRLNRWGGEAYIEVSLPTSEKISPTTTTEKVVWEGQTVDAHFYPLEPTEQYELGGFEFEVILKEKPLTNKIVLDFETHNLKFYYQPPLTAEFASGWSDEFQCEILVTETTVTNLKTGGILVHRPENVVGSYAVYHATKGGWVTPQDVAKGITTGQGFMIYRPKIIDAKGVWAWSEQYIDPISGKQIITIPQKFLDTAAYPIRHAAGDTFGYTDIGGTLLAIGTFGPYETQFTCGADGTATSLSIYCKNDEALAYDYKGAIYDDDGGDADVLLKTTDAVEVPASTEGWYVFDLTTTLEVTATTVYHLASACETTELGGRGYYAAGDANQMGTDQTAWADLWPNPFQDTAARARKQSIYCTYTPDAGIVAPTVVTNNATSVEETTATLSGNITATGGENCTDRGFEWDVDSGTPYADNWTEAGNFGVGNFTHGATSLPTGTTIYYRASANNSAGWGYGSEVTFTTQSAAAPPPAFPSEILPEGIPAPIGIGHLAWFIPLVLFSVPAFWRRNALLFMLAAACSLMMGFYWYVIFTTNLGLSLGIVLVGFGLVCLVFAIGCLFKRRRTSE